MFLIRQSRPDDSATLVKLARMVYFINLPPSEGAILEKIAHSAECFQRAAGLLEEAQSSERRGKRGGASAGYGAIERDSEMFMFTIEEVESRGVIGTSQIRSHQGGPGNPNWSFRISEKTFRSENLGWGSTHKVGQLYGDETGPSELGGLVLQPSHRGHRLRPGRLLSFIRFHFMGLHRERFADRIIAEMLGPVTSDGDNNFWDHFGRKFIPVKFAEADRFCQHNRGFISELLPKEEIYLSLFPLEVQNQIGVVSRETIPARRLLESLGFQHKGFVDPFDGGPHLEAQTDSVQLIRSTRRVEMGKAVAADRAVEAAIVSYTDEEGEFRAIDTRVELDGDSVRLTHEAVELLEAPVGATLGFTSLKSWDTHGKDASGAASAAKPSKAGKAVAKVAGGEKPDKPGRKVKGKRVRA